MKRIEVAIWVAVATSVVPALIYSAPGDLDPTLARRESWRRGHSYDEHAPRGPRTGSRFARRRQDCCGGGKQLTSFSQSRHRRQVRHNSALDTTFDCDG